MSEVYLNDKAMHGGKAFVYVRLIFLTSSSFYINFFNYQDDTVDVAIFLDITRPPTDPNILINYPLLGEELMQVAIELGKLSSLVCTAFYDLNVLSTENVDSLKKLGYQVMQNIFEFLLIMNCYAVNTHVVIYIFWNWKSHSLMAVGT